MSLILPLIFYCLLILFTFNTSPSIYIYSCAVGSHSQSSPGTTISASPNATPAAGTGSTDGSTTSFSTAHVKSIADYNAQNPTASTAAASAVKIVSAERKSSRLPDGQSAKCQRKGCQKQFLLCDNCETACLYHRGHPIFHDAVKFWSCCAEKKCYDFDEFLAVTGCAFGFHDDGVIELDS